MVANAKRSTLLRSSIAKRKHNHPSSNFVFMDVVDGADGFHIVAKSGLYRVVIITHYYSALSL